MQRNSASSVFAASSVKTYCITRGYGDTFMQCSSATQEYLAAAVGGALAGGVCLWLLLPVNAEVVAWDDGRRLALTLTGEDGRLWSGLSPALPHPPRVWPPYRRQTCLDLCLKAG